MKMIPLTQGQFALVDDEDYDWLMQWKWNADKIGKRYYAFRGRTIHGKHITISMHRAILGLQPGDKREVDHINGNGLDNRRCNIRDVSHQENQCNRHGAKGYTWYAPYRKWRVRLKTKGVETHIGYFDDTGEAHAAYLAAKAELHKIGGVPCVG